MTFQQSPYLRNQRSFPNDDIKRLSLEIDKTYIDIATKVNDRTIGVFGLLSQTITGEQWYLSGQSQNLNGLRKVFSFSATGSIAHGINFSSITSFSKPFGTYSDGTNISGRYLHLM